VQIWDPAVKYKGPLIADADAYMTGYEKAFGSKPNYITASGTAGALALQLAIEKAGSLDPVQVRDAMLKLDVETFFGHFQFDQNGVDVRASAVISQVQGGKAIPVYPTEIAAAAIRYPRKPFE
jgi:branched-chain amino acid transport system substrate-binding protein